MYIQNRNNFLFQVIFAAMLALASAAPSPSLLAAPALTAYAAPALTSYAAPALTSYAAPAVAVHNVPVVTTGYRVAYSVEPVEQHGYKIVY